MPYAEIDVNKTIEEKCAQSPEFKKAWEDNKEEFRLIGEMISLRKQQNITQRELARLTGNKQQVISRIEKRQNTPSIKTFSSILNALGYELQIVKRV